MSRHELVSPKAGRATRLGLIALITTLLVVGCSPVPRKDQPTDATASPPASSSVNSTGSPATTGTGPAMTTPAAPAPGPAPGPATTVTSPGDPPRPTPSPSPSPDSKSLDNAVIEPGGVGPIRIGMSLSEAKANGWVAMGELCERWDASPELLDRGLSLTFIDDKLYEIWVRGVEFSTEKNIRVSDNLQKARVAYGTELRTELRDGAGGQFPAWFVTEGEHELLFLEEDAGGDETIRAILARTHGTPVVEGC